MTNDFDRFERFTCAVIVINRYWRKIAAKAMKKYGLKGAFTQYLMALYRSPDGLNSVDLGKACDKNKADVSRALATLEEKGLAERESVTGKSLYRAKIKLTAEGTRVAEEIRGSVEHAVELGGRNLSETQRELFYKALESISDNMRGLSDEDDI